MVDMNFIQLAFLLYRIHVSVVFTNGMKAKLYIRQDGPHLLFVESCDA